jgi:hypothetical protein
LFPFRDFITGMETTSKFFLKSLTIWGLIIAGVCRYVQHLTGVNLSDQVGPLQHAIVALVQALPSVAAPIGQIVGVIVAIVGRFRSTQPLHVFKPVTVPAVPRGLQALALVCFCLFLFGAIIGCAGNAPAPSPTPSPAPTLEQTIAADFKGLTSDALSFANGLQKLNNGNAIPPAAVTAILALTHNSGDATTAAALNNLLGQFIAAQSTASSSSQSVTNVNQVLAPANVNATVQAVAPAVAPTPATNATYYIIRPTSEVTRL